MADRPLLNPDQLVRKPVLWNERKYRQEETGSAGERKDSQTSHNFGIVGILSLTEYTLMQHPKISLSLFQDGGGLAILR